jgi:two-component system response regulator DegU
MFRLKSCPKCKGAVRVDQDEHGWYEYCLHCGHMRDLESLLVEDQEQADETKTLKQSMGKQATKVSVFSNQPLLREGILHSLSRTVDIQVISQAKASDKQSIINGVQPDVVIVDVDGPFDGGWSLVQRLRQGLPKVSLILLTTRPSDVEPLQAVNYRVAAYLSKEINADQLAEVVRQVANGEYPINESLSRRPELTGKILSELKGHSRETKDEASLARLTTRETEILNYVAQGYSNKQIAVKFDISEQTIKNHLSNIMIRLNTRARTQAVVKAAQQGLISIA